MIRKETIMQEIYQFSEENFIDCFIHDLKTKAVCFTDIDFSNEYIENEIKPMLNIVDFMFTHHFISENGYFRCKNIHQETIEKAANVLKEKCIQIANENNKIFEQRKMEQKKYIENFIENHKIGDKVAIKGTLIGTKLPRYLESCGFLTIEGFTRKGNVKCRYDSETVFSISPCYLKDIKKKNS